MVTRLSVIDVVSARAAAEHARRRPSNTCCALKHDLCVQVVPFLGIEVMNIAPSGTRVTLLNLIPCVRKRQRKIIAESRTEEA
ncbi:hypothetical protein EVAR_12431_1 [Eumeta japonica]|uniref:Uncharacterized protein n=1 Tax=Eumeta variegata TaxID=151549 RepID=A0A4C1TZB5_EUMVA|nr:hypothetical protein EVAR_12431_1 [Eumeta japonica]